MKKKKILALLIFMTVGSLILFVPAPVAGQACKTTTDCGTSSNPCAQLYCAGYFPASGTYPEIMGTCKTNYTYGNVCGTSPLGGNMYCGGSKNALGQLVPDGVCYDNLCKDKSECDDGNICTTDSCSGYQPYVAAYCDGPDCYPAVPEKLGTCANSNIPPWTICQRDVSNNPQKLCSPSPPYSAISPTSPVTPISTCSVDYIACTDTRQTPSDANQYACCGLVNLQTLPQKLGPYGYYLPGSCNKTIGPDGPRLPNVPIHVRNSCGTDLVKPTDANGVAYFANLDFAEGNKTNFNELQYDVWADIPTNYTFTRGTYFYSNSKGLQLDHPPIQTLGPGGAPFYTGVESRRYSTCFFGDGCNTGFISRWLNFGFLGPPTYKISGKVMMDNNFDVCQTSTQVVPGAFLSAIPLNLAGSPAPQISDGNGNYQVDKLPAGHYSLKIDNLPGRPIARRVDGAWSSSASLFVTYPDLPALPPDHIVDFCISPISAWIQTTKGDVHSNIKINTPGGP